eukprot:gene1193-2321_t
MLLKIIRKTRNGLRAFIQLTGVDNDSYGSYEILTLPLIAIIGAFLCIIPLIMEYEFNNGDYEISSAPVYFSMTSISFQFSLVASIAISIPMAIDGLLSMINSDNEALSRGWISRALLVLTLFFPDLIILVIAIPSKDPGLMAIIFQVRAILCMYAIMSQLWEFGGFVLRCKLFFTNLLGLFIFVICGYRWFKHITGKPLNDMTSSEYICNVFLISTSIAFIILTIMSIITGGTVDYNTSGTYLTSYTYVVVAFKVSISILQSRLINKEMHQVHARSLGVYLRFAGTAESLMSELGGVAIECCEYDMADANVNVMSFSNAIVQLHHGNVFVTSEGEGRGCTFSVEIPLYMGQSSLSALKDSVASIIKSSNFTESFRSNMATSKSNGSASSNGNGRGNGNGMTRNGNRSTVVGGAPNSRYNRRSLRGSVIERGAFAQLTKLGEIDDITLPPSSVAEGVRNEEGEGDGARLSSINLLSNLVNPQSQSQSLTPIPIQIQPPIPIESQSQSPLMSNNGDSKEAEMELNESISNNNNNNRIKKYIINGRGNGSERDRDSESEAGSPSSRFSLGNIELSIKSTSTTSKRSIRIGVSDEITDCKNSNNNNVLEKAIKAAYLAGQEQSNSFKQKLIRSLSPQMYHTSRFKPSYLCFTTSLEANLQNFCMAIANSLSSAINFLLPNLPGQPNTNAMRLNSPYNPQRQYPQCLSFRSTPASQTSPLAKSQLIIETSPIKYFLSPPISQQPSHFPPPTTISQQP